MLNFSRAKEVRFLIIFYALFQKTLGFHENPWFCTVGSASQLMGKLFKEGYCLTSSMNRPIALAPSIHSNLLHFASRFSWSATVTFVHPHFIPTFKILNNTDILRSYVQICNSMFINYRPFPQPRSFLYFFKISKFLNCSKFTFLYSVLI